MLRAFKKFFSNPFDRLVRNAVKDNRSKFLFVWNRGLGDIALGLYALVYRLRQEIPNAQITFVTRLELEEGFLLLQDVEVLAVPSMHRGRPVDLDRCLKEMGRNRHEWEIILEKIDATDWFSWQIGKLTPKLHWKEAYDAYCEPFDLPKGRAAIAIHLCTETEQFYGYRKDWPISHWQELLEKIEKTGCPVLIFGLQAKHRLKGSSVIDLRGKTHLLEMLSLIKNRCHTLIAPDGGVLSLAYYLDAAFPMTLISLWSDPRQGILKQAVASPNPLLNHSPLIAKDRDLSTVTAQQVVEKIVLQNIVFS